jgi:hypothetical protein
VDEAKLWGGLVGPENRRRRPSSLRRLRQTLEWCHFVGLLGAAPSGGTAGRRDPQAVREYLGEDIRGLDPSSNGGRRASDDAHGRARRRYEQRRLREEGVPCGVSLALLRKDKAQVGGDARGGAKRWMPVGSLAATADRALSTWCGHCSGLTRTLERVDGGLGPFPNRGLGPVLIKWARPKTKLKIISKYSHCSQLSK